MNQVLHDENLINENGPNKSWGLEKNSKINKWGAGATFRHLRVKVQKKDARKGKIKEKMFRDPSEIFSEISRLINICQKDFLAHAKALRFHPTVYLIFSSFQSL